MLTIRLDQLRAISRARLAALAEGIAAQHSAHGDAQAPGAVRARVVEALDLALQHGFDDGPSATAFVELSLLWGVEFVSLPWAREVLEGDPRGPAHRIRALIEASAAAQLARLADEAGEP
jgi:hypothetical protein